MLAGLHRDLATADEGEDDDIDPALAGCLSLSLGGHLRARSVPDPALAKGGVSRPPRQLDLFGARPLADVRAWSRGRCERLCSRRGGFVRRTVRSTG